MGLLFIIAWPISKALDAILGVHEGTYFRRGGMREKRRGKKRGKERNER
jgi:hypothetical protein